MRLNFVSEIYDTNVEDQVNETVHQVLGEDVELDWRDEQELEIHNVVKKGLEDELTYQITKVVKRIEESEYEIYGVEIKNSVVTKDCCIICVANEIDEGFKKLKTMLNL